jgi:uncharacterized membrane protein
MNNFWVLFLVFTIYSFLGWLTESIFCSVPEGKFINRGFLTGPFCPIYGIGAVVVITLLSPFKDNWAVLYFLGVAITTSLEYLTGYLLEKIFHTTYWDYSALRFNIKGRVCLQNSLLFGLMCLVGVVFIHPAVMYLADSIPDNLLPYIAILCMLYFLFDTAVSVRAALQLNGKLEELQQILDSIKERASAATADTIESIQAKIGNLLDDDTRAFLKLQFEKKDKIESNIKFYQRRIVDAFPTMRSISNNESLQRLKEAIKSRAQNIKRK